MSLFKLAQIHIKESHKGLLHKELHVPEGEKIPTSTLKERMAHSTDPKERKRLNFAINARKWHHK